MSAAPKPLPRSPAGLLSAQLTDEPLSRSPSALSSTSTSASPLNYPGSIKRRSTETSGGLDYYWSSLAGAGHSSSSSSLAVSPSPSNALLSTSATSIGNNTSLPLPKTADGERSGKDIGRVDSGSSTGIGSGSPAVQMPNSQPHYPDNGSLPPQFIRTSSSGKYGQTLDTGHLTAHTYREEVSPGSWSGESDYSNEGDHSDQSSTKSRLDSIGSNDSFYSHDSPVDPKTSHMTRTAGAESRRPLLDPSTQSRSTEGAGEFERNHSRYDYRESMTSTIKPDEEEDSNEKTPMAPVYVDKSEREIHAPEPLNFDRSPVIEYPSPRLKVVSPVKQSTPTRPIASPSAAGYTPTSGRMPFNMPITEHRSAPSPRLGTEEREASVPPPQSAPAWQSEFGAELQSTGDADSVDPKAKRTTLPATPITGTFPTNNNQSVQANMLSPDKYGRQGALTPEKRDKSREPSPARSPDPPPRSTLRALYSPRGSMETTRSADTAPLNISPRHSSKDLPTIINTAHSPLVTPDKTSDPPRPTRSPSRTPDISQSATIRDLTDLLGGAIDAIGLIDSRDTPPPTVLEPSKDVADRHAGATSSGTIASTGLIAPPPLPSREAAAVDKSHAVPPPLPTRPVESVRRVPSGLSLRDINRAPQPIVQSPPIITSFSQRPWPAAMLFGNIKGMKYCGDRAIAYAKNINDLARADSGLREWCIASTSSTSTSSRPPMKNPKTAGLSGLGIRSTHSSASTLTVPQASHLRNVSSSSEFPMRADSYTAREISQRAVDPSDAPNSLPPNLPYPQLQAQYASGAIGSSGGIGGGGGMKPSASMQSVSSFSSKRSFFGGIGKKSNKKDTALGPPSGSIKKDVRGLHISSPAYSTGSSSSTQTATTASTTTGAPHPHRLSESVAAPLGPRGQNPRIGSFTPPPQNQHQFLDSKPARASLDTGLSRMSSMARPRGSLDSGASIRSAGGGIGAGYRKGSVPPRAGSLIVTPPIGEGGAGEGRGVGEGFVNEDELRAMGDILPHVNKGVLRAYLGRYGDQMQAIGMYLEDEKRGKVMRV